MTKRNYAIKNALPHLEALMQAESTGQTYLLKQGSTYKETYGRGIVINKPLNLNKEKAVEVEFVDQTMNVKIIKAEPKAVSLEQLGCLPKNHGMNYGLPKTKRHHLSFHLVRE